MSQFLKQSTAATIMFGPFVDKTDGVTLEVGAGIITSIDHATTGIFLSKNGAAAAIRHQGVTASVLDAYGMFLVTLDTTDTGTVGTLDVLMAEAATFLPVHKTFMVLPANVYDSLMGTDLLDISVVQIGGTAQSATDLKDFTDTGYNPTTHAVFLVDTTTTNTDMVGTDSAALASVLGAAVGASISADLAAVKAETVLIVADTGELQADDYPTSIAAVQTAVDNIQTQVDTTGVALLATAVDAVWDEALTGATHNIATSAGKRLRQAGIDVLLIREETCQAGASASTVIIDNGASGTNNFYDHMSLILTGGTGSGQVRSIHNYVGASFTADVEPDWLTTPDETSTYTIIATGSVHVHEITADGLAQINAEVDTALDTAVPGAPTAHSINERVKAVDDLTQASGAGDLASVKGTVEAIPTTAMRGTDSAALASAWTATRAGYVDELAAANLPTVADAIQAKTDLLPSEPAKNVALSNFTFLMVLASDHVTPATGKTIVEEISKDGGAFAACTNAAAEIGNGFYKIDLTQAEMNANVIALKFTETDCDQRSIVIVTST